MPNPRSLQILSQQFVDLLLPRAKDDLQLFPAPLVSATTSEQLRGYHVVNCVQRLPCLDRERAIYKWDQEIDELVVYKLAVDATMVPDAIQIFRVDECPYRGLIFRDLVGQGLRGVAFIKC